MPHPSQGRHPLTTSENCKQEALTAHDGNRLPKGLPGDTNAFGYEGLQRERPSLNLGGQPSITWGALAWGVNDFDSWGADSAST